MAKIEVLRSREGYPLPQILQRSEVADYLRVSTRTIEKLIKAGEIETISVGRRRLVTQDAVLAYLNRKEEGEATKKKGRPRQTPTV